MRRADPVGREGCFPAKAGTQTGLPPSRENKEAGGMVGGSGMTDVVGRFAHTTPIALSCCVPSPVIPADAGTHGRGPGNDGGISLRPPQPWVPAFAGMTEGGGLGLQVDGAWGELANCGNIHPTDLPPPLPLCLRPQLSRCKRREGAGGLPPTPPQTYFTRRCEALLGRTGAKPLSSDGAGAPPAGQALWIHI